MRIGILGSGQLGRMLAEASAQLDHTCIFYDGDFNDRDATTKFADKCDVITYEFENVPCETARFLERIKPVYPPPEALDVSQDRLTEKRFLERLGIRTSSFKAASSESGLNEACDAVGYPCIAKTRRLGYDGKGQFRINTRSEVPTAWQTLKSDAIIVEAFVPFSRELSVIATRDRRGNVVVYPLILNTHIDGVLHRSEIPAPNVTPQLQERAHASISKILESLDYVGTLALELFEIDGDLLANEMAPRVHNSGHATIEGNKTSQFSNHIRAIAGSELGESSALTRAVMFNIIGKVPDLEPVRAMTNAAVHLYGKEERPGRKLGHITLTDPTIQQEILMERLCAR